MSTSPPRLPKAGLTMRLIASHSALRIVILTAFSVTFLIAGTYSIQGQTPDDHGNTPATATPIDLGDSVAGRIDPGDDMDVFEIDLSHSTGTTDIWAYTTGEVDTVGGLYDSEGSLLLFNDDGSIEKERATSTSDAKSPRACTTWWLSVGGQFQGNMCSTRVQLLIR